MAETAAIALVEELCEALAAAPIRYCHWKSTAALDRSASGENDLDLLVHRGDWSACLEILHRLGFKEARAPAGAELPGILDYYGYDPGSDRFVHVHLHAQLVLGHDRTKGYRLPIEEPFLASSVRRGPFRIPAPEFELLVLVVRMMLKYATWDAQLLHSSRLKPSERDELEQLAAHVQPDRVAEIIREHVPYLNPNLLLACLHSLREGAAPLHRIRLAGRLQRGLRAQARRSRTADVVLKIARRAAQGLRRRLCGGLRRKRLARGGMMIALVGGDGAGKTTALEALHAWLATHFDVRLVHLGRPRWSLTTRVVRASLKLRRVAEDTLLTGQAGPAGRDLSAFQAFRAALWSTCAARDRYRAYRRARRFATNGGLVLCDRFPLPQIQLMDAPAAHRQFQPGGMGPLARVLDRIERRYYTMMPVPELVLLLRLDPETAVARKTDETPESVFTRTREVWECDWTGSGVQVLDASRTAEAVLAELKTKIWSAL